MLQTAINRRRPEEVAARANSTCDATCAQRTRTRLEAPPPQIGPRWLVAGGAAGQLIPTRPAESSRACRVKCTFLRKSRSAGAGACKCGANLFSRPVGRLARRRRRAKLSHALSRDIINGPLWRRSVLVTWRPTGALVLVGRRNRRRKVKRLGRLARHGELGSEAKSEY